MLLKRALVLLKEEEGQSKVEYGIILALIAAVAIGLINNVGTKVKDAFGTINTGMTPGGTNSGGNTVK